MPTYHIGHRAPRGRGVISAAHSAPKMRPFLSPGSQAWEISAHPTLLSASPLLYNHAPPAHGNRHPNPLGRAFFRQLS